MGISASSRGHGAFVTKDDEELAFRRLRPPFNSSVQHDHDTHSPPCIPPISTLRTRRCKAEL